MELYKVLQPDFNFEDVRGKLCQLVHENWQQVNVLVTKAGVVRGVHYHKVSKEAFYIISGSVDVRFRNGSERDYKHFVKGDFFMVMPEAVHELSFPEDCVMVQLYDIPVENVDGSKDIYVGEI